MVHGPAEGVSTGCEPVLRTATFRYAEEIYRMCKDKEKKEIVHKMDNEKFVCK